MGGLPRAPWRFDCELGTTFQYSYSHNDMLENFIVIKLTFTEIFAPQDFTIRTTPVLSRPRNTCGVCQTYNNKDHQRMMVYPMFMIVHNSK